MNKIISHKYSIYIFLFLFSFLFNFYYGYRGILPIDSFLIFDSGYFVLKGEYPFRDFWTITGPLLDYLQSFFFYIFGINWSSYVIHASLINFILVIFSYFFFKKLGLNKLYSILYSVGVSILAYPSIGTPFPDHHAFIFSLIAVYFMILATIEKKNYYYFFVTLFLFLSFLSKQVNSFYLTIFFSLIIFINIFLTKEKNLNNIFYFILGGLIPLTIFFIFLKITNTPLQNFFIQYILYPASIGTERIQQLKFDLKEVFGQFKFIYFAVLPAIIIFFYNIFNSKKKVLNKIETNIFIIFVGSIFIFLYSQLLTKNQILIFSLIPVCIAFSHRSIMKFYHKNYLIYLILIIFLYSTFKYHIRFNENKKFMELEKINIENSVDGVGIDDSLSRLKWINHLYPKNPLKETILLKQSLNLLKLEKNNKIVITDYQFASTLIENEYSSPNQWHDIRSVPSKKNKFYSEYKNFFLNKLKKNKVKKIYFIGQYKEIFFLSLLDEKSCTKRTQINELLSVHYVKNCT